MDDAKRFILGFGVVYLAIFAWSLNFERPEFRPWELVKDLDTPYFLPNRSVEMEEVGDLSFRAWIRALQRPRQTKLSTDDYGFRNMRGIERPQVVVLGDSFVAGSGLTDEQTLAVRLSKRLGEPVYSVAVATANSPSLFLSEPRFATHPPRVVVFAPINRLVRPLRLMQADFRRPKASKDGPLAAAGAAIKDAGATLNRDNGFSRAMRFGYNGLLYALRGHPAVVRPEAEVALALPLEEQLCFLTPEQRGLDAAIETLRELQRRLAARGTRLIYAPIPDSAEVYPELFPPEEIARCARPSLFDRLVPAALAAGIDAVDLRAAFRANKWPYLYRLDDSHWQPLGVEVAAAAIAEAITSPAPAP